MILDEILNTIENDDMKEFAEELIKTIPPYFFHVAASSSGKFHSQYALGEGGLARHTCSLVRILNHIFNIECMNLWTSRERDMLRIACMMHDSRKSGSQEDYEKNKYTKFNHPLLAAEIIESFDGKFLNHEEISIISSSIRSHMGQWNTDSRSDVILPKPHTKYEKIVHMVDYLASRKDIEIKFDDNPDAYPLPDIKTWTMPCGKYKGLTLSEICDVDPNYLRWIANESDMGKTEPLKTFLTKLKEKKDED